MSEGRTAIDLSAMSAYLSGVNAVSGNAAG